MIVPPDQARELCPVRLTQRTDCARASATVWYGIGLCAEHERQAIKYVRSSQGILGWLKNSVRSEILQVILEPPGEKF